MNILLEFSTSNYKIWHSLAKRLKEIYPESRFAGIVGIAPGSEAMLGYLQNDKDIEYEFLEIQHEIIGKALKDGADYIVLKEFENSLLSKSIWRLISADRKLGNAFMHDTLINKLATPCNIDRDSILSVFSNSLKQYRDIFKRFNTNLFLPAIAMGSISVFIYEQICKEMNIPYIVPTNVRVKNIFAFSSDVQLRFPQIDQAYKELMSGKSNIGLLKAQKLYEELISASKANKNFEKDLPCFNIAKLNSLYSYVSFILSSIKTLLAAIWLWFRQNINRKKGDIRFNDYGMKVLTNSIKNVVIKQRNKFYVLQPDFGIRLKPGQKYIYYPLHISPEYSTQIQGTMWLDQIHLVEALAKSIPHDWVVYIKEHPATLTYRARPADFYKNIMRFPNVYMAPIDMDTYELISKAEMVASITGTTGWEAIQQQKPLITFADNFWDVLELSRKCTDLEALSIVIYDERIRINNLPYGEKRKRLIYFLAAILEHGFKLTYPHQFCYEKGTDNQYEVVGRETADALKKHIDYINLKERKAV